MNKTLLLFISLCLLGATPSYAKKQYILIGGGGEPTNATDGRGNPILGTMFDDDIQDVRAFLNKAPEWQKEVSFNGGHPKTEEILRTSYKDTNATSFTTQQYKKLIADYVTKINNGEFTKGDQILIHIATHGAIKVGGQLTHSVATANNALQNYDTLGGDLADLDELKRLSDLANQKGIKLGIIDESCHSGNSLSLANDNTCVLTITGPLHYGWNGGNSNPDVLNKNLVPGKSLEDIYLKARRESADTGFPMISSPEGKKVQDQLYEMLTPYLYAFDSNHDKLLPYMTSGEQDLLCKYDSNFAELNNIISQMLDINRKTTTPNTKLIVELENLKKAIGDYYTFQRGIVQDLQGVDFSLLKNEEEIKAQEKVGLMTYTMTYKFTWRELMTMDYDKRISEMQERLAAATTKDDQLNLRLNIAALRNSKKRGEELKVKYPELINTEDKLNSIANKEARSYDMANKIGRLSRTLYDALYRDYQKQGPSLESNPCKDFIL